MRHVDRLAKIVLRRWRGNFNISESAIDERQSRELMRQFNLLNKSISALTKVVMMELKKMNQFFKEEMDNLKKEVEETRGSIESFKVYASGLSQKLNAVADSASDAESMRKEIRAVADSLNTMQDDIAKAIAANDPAVGGGTGGGEQPGSAGGSMSGANPNE